MADSRSSRWFTVPIGTPKSRCLGPTCGRQDIYWIETRWGRRMPIDCAVPGGREPSAKFDPAQQDLFGGRTEPRDGRGVSHFETCKDADYFRGGRRS